MKTLLALPLLRQEGCQVELLLLQGEALLLLELSDAPPMFLFGAAQGPLVSLVGLADPSVRQKLS